MAWTGTHGRRQKPGSSFSGKIHIEEKSLMRGRNEEKVKVKEGQEGGRENERAAKLGTKKRPGKKRRKTAKNKRVRDTNVRLFHTERENERRERGRE